MKAVYFASVRERIGVSEEEIAPPANVTTVAELIAWLAERGEGYAAAFANAGTIRAAIDKTHARPDDCRSFLRDEIAFFPPMTRGMRCRAHRARCAEPFDAAREEATAAHGRPDIGALVSFTGFAGTKREPRRRWSSNITRHGRERDCRASPGRPWRAGRCRGLPSFIATGLIRPGEKIVLVLAAARHRGEAFAAAEFLMDYLKTRAPFWKKEHRADGASRAAGWRPRRRTIGGRALGEIDSGPCESAAQGTAEAARSRRAARRSRPRGQAR